jgi:hypothetical protein
MGRLSKPRPGALPDASILKKEGEVMVMDNLEVHPRGPQGSLIVGELIEQAGASVLFLPPYSLAHRRSVLQGQEHPA